ncbi:MAG: histidinol dehydrogenase [Alphaproteobacteria bacterium]
MPRRLDAGDPGFAEAFTELVQARKGGAPDVEAAVAAILADVRARGDAAVIDYSRRFDGLELEPGSLRVDDDEIEAAVTACPPETRTALEMATGRIEAFHRRQLPTTLAYRDGTGARLGARWTPIAEVGLYVPGGRAAYPSSVLMNALPAKIAGVERLVMAVPAPDGRLDGAVLAAARLAGVHEVYRIGGAQAIAALAFGTETVAPVDKIVGPGNAYVAAAKRQVFGVVGVDLIAGPSEVVVVADARNDSTWIAADLLAQAEHDPAAQAILITDDQDFGDAVVRAAKEHLRRLPHPEVARASWETHGAVIVVRRLAEAVPLVDRLAPEHLELAIARPEPLAEAVRNAGAIFLGRFTPEAVGDYVAGPNHVLPTARTARFASGLSVLDFLKRTTLVRCDARSLAALGPTAVALARAEGLEAHALSVAIRLPRTRRA